MNHKSHASSAAEFLEDSARVSWHDDTLWWIRAKRDKAVDTVPDWEALREAASEIKRHTLSRLDTYLVQLETQAIQNGIHVHWAANAEEHNRIVYNILSQHHAANVVKSKSMLTEECHLNPYLEERGIQVTDTDLGEYIVQLRHEPPSHIVLPAIHLKKKQVSDTFHTHLNTDPDNLSPDYLTAAARDVLRKKFYEADAAITGVNFAVAENGLLVICTNEGNADMGMHLAKVHIACMGIEKVIPTIADLPVFLRLLARSATGQASTAYTSHIRKPGPGRELHLVLVDNGRTAMLAQPHFRDALKCIRCGACFNTCPVYRRSGGHSYHTSVAGPIGSVLSPGQNLAAHGDLPFASTLCGSCSQVCPVKIDIHGQLWQWRQEAGKTRQWSASKKLAGKGFAFLISRPRLFRAMLAIASRAGNVLSKRPFRTLTAWTRHRNLPPAPQTRFDSWYNNQYEQQK
jgi:L-lactate dehydrogenase complex protein LldF